MEPTPLIIAANGRVASRVAAKLTAAGSPPDVLVRDLTKAERVLVDDRGRPTYGALFVGELANDETMPRAMSRASVAFLAVGSSPAQTELEKRDILIAGATPAGVLLLRPSDSATEDGSVAYALTYGMGFQLLEPSRLDNLFGQRIAIRTAEPDKLRSLTVTTMDERSRTSRATIPQGAASPRACGPPCRNAPPGCGWPRVPSRILPEPSTIPCRHAVVLQK